MSLFYHDSLFSQEVYSLISTKSWHCPFNYRAAELPFPYHSILLSKLNINFFEKSIDSIWILCYNIFRWVENADEMTWATKQIAELCKGSTTDSDSVCEGSNPSPAARPEQADDACSDFLSQICCSSSRAGEIREARAASQKILCKIYKATPAESFRRGFSSVWGRHNFNVPVQLR